MLRLVTSRIEIIRIQTNRKGCAKNILVSDFLFSGQVISPEQKISASSPAPTFSFDTRNEDSVLEFSEESLKARTFPGDLHFLCFYL